MVRIVILGFALALSAAAFNVFLGAAAPQPKADAAKLENPNPADAKSIANGKDLYEKNCAQCHGDTGKGDGMMAPDMQTKPSDLTDAAWDNGSTDGEIFAMIRDGSKTGMTPFGKKMAARVMWDLVNYVRTMGPKPKPAKKQPPRH